MTDENTNAKWATLLKRAVSEPGTLSTAYSAFHRFSFMNQLLAACECAGRGIQPGPIATFPGWLAKGRHVRKGEKAITLCMPIMVKAKAEKDEDGEVVDGGMVRVFVFRPRWFVLAQTDGQDVAPEPTPEWNASRALAALEIEEVDFRSTDGNVQGYCRERTIAVSPIAAHPMRTRLHEIAHVLLGHTDRNDTDCPDRSIGEAEAECTALLVGSALGVANLSESAGYVQHWLAGTPLPERTAQRILSAADKILRAGQAQPTEAA